MINNHKKQKGFTLAETLVTLGVIGVIAAVTIPLIKNIVPNSNKSMFRKSYYTLERAIDRMLDDDSIYPNIQTYTDSNEVTVPYYLYDKIDYKNETESKNKFCYYLQQYLNTAETYTCPTTLSTTATKFATTTDSIDWYIRTKSSTETQQFIIDPSQKRYAVGIIVDVNGVNKKPNCTADSLAASKSDYPTGYTASATACKNPDTFILEVRYDGKLRIANSSEDETITAITDTVAQSILSDPTNNKKD